MAGIELILATDLGALSKELAERLKPRLHDREALFIPAEIIVPSRTMQTHLEMELARRLGVTPNLRFRLLRTFLADVISAGDTPGAKYQILGADHLHHILIDLLRANGRGALSLAECAPINRYLKTEGGYGEVVRERRLYQLCREVARLFIEYSFSRSAPVFGPPEAEGAFLARWLDDERALDDERDEIAAWQRALWREIFAPEGALTKLNAAARADDRAELVTLTQAFATLSESPAARAQLGELPDNIYMVGFPYIARLFMEAVGLLGQFSTIKVFSLTPTARWIEAAPGRVHTPENELHPLLAQWGYAGRQARQMWEKYAPTISAAPEPKDGTSDNLLSEIQRDIRLGQAALPDAKTQTYSEKDPAGVAFLECPSIAREVEAVAEQIWRLMLENDRAHRISGAERLRMDDIAVLIAGSDQSLYQTHIAQIFPNFPGLKRPQSGETIGLNPVYVGLPPAREGRVLEAVELLLALPFGRFRRRELLRLLLHPNLRGPAEGDDDLWADWCEKLNIFWGADRDDQRGSYLNESKLQQHTEATRWDLYNWDQGFRRVLLGTLRRGPRSGVDALLEMNGSQYQPLETSSETSDSAARFVALTSSLIQDARWLVEPGNTFSMQKWAEIVERFLRIYLRAGSWADTSKKELREEDARNFSAACRAIRQIGASCPVEGPASYRLFYEFARDAVDKLRQSGQHHLASGVIVSSVLELRALPFKHIFVMGLGEGLFPNPARQDALDLRQRDPRPGDLSPTDRDRFAFLEVLLAARESLTLSWVAREATSGDKLNASSLVNELRWALEERFGVPTQTQGALTHVAPLRADEGSIHPGVLADLRAQKLRERLTAGANLDREKPARPLKMPSLRELLSSGGAPPLPDDLIRALKLQITAPKPAPKPAPDAVPGTLQSPRKRPQEPPRRRIRITISQLQKFLECPLQGAARVQLGLREEEDSLFSQNREDLESSPLNQAILLNEVVETALARPDREDPDILEEIYDTQILLQSAILGTLPAGHFLKKNRDQHLQILKAWWGNLGEHYKDNWPVYRLDIGVGAPGREEYLEPVRLKITHDSLGRPPQPIIVEISGKTQFTTADGSLYLTLMTSKNDISNRLRYMGRSYLSWLVATVAGRQHPASPADITLAVNAPQTHSSSTTYFKNPAPKDVFDAPEDRLTSLVTSLLFESHDYLAPINFAAEIKRKTKPDEFEDESLQTWLDKELSSEYSSVSSKYGPIRDYKRFRAPKSGVKEILEERFPYIEWKK